MPSRLRGKDGFINCPFDDACKPTFHAILFAVYYLGFAARCDLEVDDASELRLDKITRIIGQCAYGVHDISSVELGAGTNLPRFNMPLELGLYLGSLLSKTRVTPSYSNEAPPQTDEMYWFLAKNQRIGESSLRLGVFA